MRSEIERINEAIPALRRYAWALLRSDQDADDLVQDCLARALASLPSQSREPDIRPWLFTILHNLHVSRLRRKRTRGVTVPLDEVQGAPLSTLPTQEHGLHVSDLQRGLDELPEEQRSVLILVCVEELSYANVARVLDIPVGTVMSRLSRARERLRAHMDGQQQPKLRRIK